jgi:hypothetical protein
MSSVAFTPRPRIVLASKCLSLVAVGKVSSIAAFVVDSPVRTARKLEDWALRLFYATSET